MFERYTCWDSASAPDILVSLALEGNEALFRATHSPISGLVITGTEAHDVARSTEQGLLDSATELYQVLDLYNHIILFFNRAIHFTVKGFESEAGLYRKISA